MKEYEEIEKVELKVVEITCDKCGKTADEKQFQYGGIPMHTITISGGYNSRWPGDLTTVEADLCEDCLEELIGDFATVRKSKILSRVGIE